MASTLERIRHRVLPATAGSASAAASAPAAPEPCNAPVASFDVDLPSGPSPHTVTFTNTSTQVDCPIETWIWDFGDSTLSTMKDPPQHTYSYDGIPPSHAFTVTLTATTPGGSHLATQIVTVGDAAPCAGPDGGLHRPNPAGAPARWTSDSPTHRWKTSAPSRRGPGTSGTARPSPPTRIPRTRSSTHGPEPETYTIRLTVTSAAGSDFFEDSLVVDPAP